MFIFPKLRRETVLVQYQHEATAEHCGYCVCDKMMARKLFSFRLCVLDPSVSKAVKVENKL